MDPKWTQNGPKMDPEWTAMFNKKASGDPKGGHKTVLRPATPSHKHGLLLFLLGWWVPLTGSALMKLVFDEIGF